MQWASSTAISAMPAAAESSPAAGPPPSSDANRSKNPSLTTRSGDTYSRRNSPAWNSASTRRASAGSSEELYAAAATPLARSASTWSFINEMSGDTTMPVPGRSIARI